MTVYDSFDDLHIEGPVCLALGNFDGLHPGHRALIERCVELSESRGWIPAVFTFSGLTANALGEGKKVKQLLPLSEKLRLLEELGVRAVISVPFTKEIMELSPADFVDRLVSSMDLRCTVCGFNFRFGHKAAGTSSFLAGMGLAYGFEAKTVPEVRINGEIISSTLLRGILAEKGPAAYEEAAGAPFYIISESLVYLGRGEEGAVFGVDPLQAMPKAGPCKVMYEDEKLSVVTGAVISEDEGGGCRIYLDAADDLSFTDESGRLKAFKLEFI